MPNGLKQLVRKTGLSSLYWWGRNARQRAPLTFVNWLFQRVIGLNRDCAWPVNFTSRVMHPRNLHVAPGARASFALSGGCYIQATNHIYIGNGTIFAPGTKIISANHDTHNLACACAARPIRIGAHCWLGANAIILPGVELGDRVTVGAGAVVTKSFPAGSTIGGIPAKLLTTAAVAWPPPPQPLTDPGLTATAASAVF